MRTVEPQVYLIASSMVDQNAANQWLQSKGVSPEGREQVIDLAPTNAASLVTMCGKRCYMSFEPLLNPNVQRVRTDMAEFIDNILKVGHGSVLEHASFTFALENVSRVFTAEMNRHRAGCAISEGSMRYIRFDDIPYWVPTSIRDADGDSKELQLKKTKTRIIMADVFDYVEDMYEMLQEIWADELAPESKFASKKQITSMMRRIIPIGVATGGVWTLNLRALRHVFTMRCSPAAEEEILLVASMMLECMIESQPEFFKDFHKENGYWKPKYNKV